MRPLLIHISEIYIITKQYYFQCFVRVSEAAFFNLPELKVYYEIFNRETARVNKTRQFSEQTFEPIRNPSTMARFSGYKKRPSRGKGASWRQGGLFILRFAPIGRAQALVLSAAALAAAADFDVIEVAPNALMVVHAAGHVAADGLFLFHCKNLLGYFAHSLPRRRTDYAFLHGIEHSICTFSL